MVHHQVHHPVYSVSKKKKKKGNSGLTQNVSKSKKDITKLISVHDSIIILLSTLPKSKSHLSQISPNSKVYTRHLSFIFYCFLPHISQIFSKSKLFLQSQEIRLRQSWLYFHLIHCSFIFSHGWLHNNQFCKVCQIDFIQVGVVCAAWWPLRAFTTKATIPASALHCVLQLKTWTKTVLTCFTKLLLSSHPWPNMNDQYTICKKNKYAFIHW